MKLVKTDLYLLLIDEEAEIQKGDLMYDNHLVGLCNCTKVVNKLPYSYTSSFLNVDKVIAYYPLTKEAKELDLLLLPKPFESLESLYKQPNIKKKPYNNIALKAIEEVRMESFLDGHFYGFEEGYKAAQSKQFTLEDMKKAVGRAYKAGFDDIEDNWKLDKVSEEIIQLLSTQQLPVGFIPEPNDIGFIKNTDIMVGKKLYDKIMSPFKTITNSDGKQEIQGKYIW